MGKDLSTISLKAWKNFPDGWPDGFWREVFHTWIFVLQKSNELIPKNCHVLRVPLLFSKTSFLGIQPLVFRGVYIILLEFERAGNEVSFRFKWGKGVWSGIHSFVAETLDFIDDTIISTRSPEGLQMPSKLHWESWRQSMAEDTPPKTNGWNLRITHLERKNIFQTFIFGFHVKFRGCNPTRLRKTNPRCTHPKFFSASFAPWKRYRNPPKERQPERLPVPLNVQGRAVNSHGDSRFHPLSIGLIISLSNHGRGFYGL